MMTQYISLSVSVIVVIALIILLIFKKRGRPYYFLMILAWLLGIVFYSFVLFREDSSPSVEVTTYSSFVRVVQYVIFGSYPILDSLELLYTKYKLRKHNKKHSTNSTNGNSTSNTKIQNEKGKIT